MTNSNKNVINPFLESSTLLIMTFPEIVESKDRLWGRTCAVDNVRARRKGVRGKLYEIQISPERGLRNSLKIPSYFGMEYGRPWNMDKKLLDIYIYYIYIIHLIYWSKQGLLGFRGKIRVKSKHPHRWRQQHLASMDQLYRPLFMVVYWGLNHLFFGLIGRLVLRWGHDNEIRGMHEVCATSGAHLFPIILDTTLYSLPKWIGPVQGHLCSVK